MSAEKIYWIFTIVLQLVVDSTGTYEKLYYKLLTGSRQTNNILEVLDTVQTIEECTLVCSYKTTACRAVNFSYKSKVCELLTFVGETANITNEPLFSVWSQMETCKDRPCHHEGHCIEKIPDLRDSNGFKCDCGFWFSGPTCEMPVPPYVSFRNSFFKLSDSRMMWNQSKGACEEEGAKLAVVPDSATNDFLKNLINTTYQGFPLSHWIDVRRLKECNYTTIHGFTDWAPGQPLCNYDCVHLWSASNLMWDDTDCKHLFNYICEITFF